MCFRVFVTRLSNMSSEDDYTTNIRSSERHQALNVSSWTRRSTSAAVRVLKQLSSRVAEGKQEVHKL